jgi:hypothetical protein
MKTKQADKERQELRLRADLRKHCEKLEHALAGVSGALVDADVVVPDDPGKYGDAVRGLTSEVNVYKRDLAQARADLEVRAREADALRLELETIKNESSS